MENIGFYDRIFRFILGIVFIILPFFWHIKGYEWLSEVIGFILISTALIGFCPIYSFLKFFTQNKIKVEYKKGQTTKSKKRSKK